MTGHSRQVWMHITTGWKWYQEEFGFGTKMLAKGYVRLRRVENSHHTCNIKREDLCAPYWMRTVI